MIRDIPLPHWPPTLRDFAEAFYILEFRNERVVRITLRPRDYEGTANSVDFPSLWGATIEPPQNDGERIVESDAGSIVRMVRAERDPA